MINLFEYQNKVPFSGSPTDLEAFLDDIWVHREQSSYYSDDEDSKEESQRFLQFLHKTSELKSNKYVGVIHYAGQKINLLPKIFYDEEKEYGKSEITQIQNHILWWLSYCRKIKFPSYISALSSLKSDFFEVIIYLFSKYTRELLSNSIYQQYEEVSNELSFIKGRINTKVYINENLASGRWHKLNCTYDAFVLDNHFNRIIKYVTTLLFNVTTSQDNKKNLREILFILDEVSEVPVTAAECAEIKFNPIFGEFETVRDYCYLFLSNSISFNYKSDMKLFAFLLPMEYVFEDFIFGFIERELEAITAKAQLSNTYLDEAENYRLRPDLFLKIGERTLIADTKYKIIYSNESDPQRGLAQSDLYQMLAYGVRFKVDEILLFYPNTVKSRKFEPFKVVIKDLFANAKEVNIWAHQLPVLDPAILNSDLDKNIDLKSIFENLKNKLKGELENILLSNSDV